MAKERATRTISKSVARLHVARCASVGDGLESRREMRKRQ
jgi:hypothetical protein